MNQIIKLECGQTDLCDIFIEYGATIDARTIYGW